jgi:hypothetical protein
MITRLPRQEFLDDYWQYEPGQHVLIVGPTQKSGKTHLAFQLLEQSVRPSLDTTVFCMKPKDRTVANFSDELGFKEIGKWPPVKHFWQDEPPAYTLWPRHSFDVAKDNEHIRSEFRKAMMDGYKKGNSLLFLDEIYGIVAELKLQEELLAILTRGGGMGCGAWMATQKPSGTTGNPLPGFVFNSPTHMFLAPDNVKANREKYADLAGNFDPKEVEQITLGLNRYEFLYLRADGAKCVISA